MTKWEKWKRRRKKAWNKIPTLTKFVVFSFASLIGYTAVSQIIGYFKGTELSTLTTCFFATFGGEVLLCALLKMLKLKKPDQQEGEQNGSETENNE